VIISFSVTLLPIPLRPGDAGTLTIPRKIP
jgi:hypothetical protein